MFINKSFPHVTKLLGEFFFGGQTWMIVSHFIHNFLIRWSISEINLSEIALNLEALHEHLFVPLIVNTIMGGSN